MANHRDYPLCRRAVVFGERRVFMSGPGASRRAVLRSGVLAVGALAGVFGLAGAAERLRTGAAPVLNADGATTLTLHGTEWHLTAPNLTRGQLPKRGDQVSL